MLTLQGSKVQLNSSPFWLMYCAFYRKKFRVSCLLPTPPYLEIWHCTMHITHWPSRKRGRNAGYSTQGPPPPSPKYGLLPLSHHIFVKSYIAPSKEWRCIWRQHMYKRLVPCGCIHINHNLNCLQITVQYIVITGQVHESEAKVGKSDQGRKERDTSC